MGKLILVSILLATIAAPALGARERGAHRGLKRTVFYLALFCALYVLVLTQVYAPQFVPEKW